jgi:epoxyqueuosine reductase
MTDKSPEDRARFVKEQALAFGFDACGIATADPSDPEDRLGEWIDRGYCAGMDWLVRTKEIRQDIQLFLPGAKSVVTVAANYYSPRPEAAPNAGRVSRYAWGRDYHRAMRKPMAALRRAIESIEPDAQCRVSVDAGPVQEREWGARAGLGWVGKNSMLIRDGLGSWFFLGVLATTVELSTDSRARNACGTCEKCVKACPTGAIVEPGVVDSRRCISYLTIEWKGEIPTTLADKFGDLAFGCDACQEACPWNRSAPITQTPDYAPRPGCANPNINEWLAMSTEDFNTRFEGSPIRRAKFEGLMRNLRIAKENVERASGGSSSFP